MRRGQIAIEYLSVMSFAVLVAAAFLIIASSAQDRVALDTASAEVDVIADYIQQELLVATSVHTGYYRIIDLPSDINGINVLYDSSGQLLSIRAGGYESIRRVPAFTGNWSGGENVLFQNDGVLSVS